MVTKKGEAIHLMHIVMRYLDKNKALQMLCDMDFEIAELTENDSLKSSIKMVRDYLEC